MLVVDGQRLIVSDSVGRSILSWRLTNAGVGTAYEAAGATPRTTGFDRLMRLIDFPQMHVSTDADSPSDNSGLFYSQNISSLGKVLGRVDSATITVHDLNFMLRRAAVCRLRRERACSHYSSRFSPGACSPLLDHSQFVASTDYRLDRPARAKCWLRTGRTL